MFWWQDRRDGSIKNTLVSGATRDGMTLIAVAMRADAGQVCQDHISMFDYGFNNFQKVEVPGGAVTIPKDVQVSDLTNTEIPIIMERIIMWEAVPKRCRRKNLQR